MSGEGKLNREMGDGSRCPVPCCAGRGVRQGIDPLSPQGGRRGNSAGLAKCNNSPVASGEPGASFLTVIPTVLPHDFMKKKASASASTKVQSRASLKERLSVAGRNLTVARAGVKQAKADLKRAKKAAKHFKKLLKAAKKELKRNARAERKQARKTGKAITAAARSGRKSKVVKSSKAKSRPVTRKASKPAMKKAVSKPAVRRKPVAKKTVRRVPSPEPAESTPVTAATPAATSVEHTPGSPVSVASSGE